MKRILIIGMTAAALLAASCGKTSSSHDHAADTTHASPAADYYTCSMHPQVHSDKPGTCPICGMTLVKASSLSAATGAGPSSVTLDERSQSLANVSTIVVTRRSLQNAVHAFGTLEIPEPNRSVISARFGGRIERLDVASSGMRVRKGEPLFDVYSPDIVQAETEYLQAFRHAGSASATTAEPMAGMSMTPRSTSASASAGGPLVEAMRSRLRLLGMTDEQIRQLESMETPPLVFTYRSPVSGTVIEKKIVQGMYIAEGTPLFEIADLSTLWDVAEVNESDAAHIRLGDKVSLSLQDQSDETSSGTVSFLYPVATSASRTVKIRVTVNNASGRLKPNMFTDTRILQPARSVLAVPVGAVLITGTRNLVYVKSDAGDHFSARTVTLGQKSDNLYEVTSGVREGETIVTEGGYLIDSESQLRTGSVK